MHFIQISMKLQLERLFVCLNTLVICIFIYIYTHTSTMYMSLYIYIYIYMHHHKKCETSSPEHAAQSLQNNEKNARKTLSGTCERHSSQRATQSFRNNSPNASSNLCLRCSSKRNRNILSTSPKVSTTLIFKTCTDKLARQAFLTATS